MQGNVTCDNMIALIINICVDYSSRSLASAIIANRASYDEL